MANKHTFCYLKRCEKAEAEGQPCREKELMNNIFILNLKKTKLMGIISNNISIQIKSYINISIQITSNI